jgi:hypothetical protein
VQLDNFAFLIEEFDTCHTDVIWISPCKKYVDLENLALR